MQEAAATTNEGVRLLAVPVTSRGCSPRLFDGSPEALGASRLPFLATSNPQSFLKGKLICGSRYALTAIGIRTANARNLPIRNSIQLCGDLSSGRALEIVDERSKSFACSEPFTVQAFVGKRPMQRPFVSRCSPNDQSDRQIDRRSISKTGETLSKIRCDADLDSACGGRFDEIQETSSSATMVANVAHYAASISSMTSQSNFLAISRSVESVGSCAPWIQS